MVFGLSPRRAATVAALGFLTASGATQAATVTTLFSFGARSTPGGSLPTGGLIIGPKVGGKATLLGTTPEGSAANQGVVFQLVPPGPAGTLWTERVLTSFAGTTDGGVPFGSLVRGNGGTIYGLTYGGTYGTAFRLSPPAALGNPWTRQVLYRFKAGQLSAAPYAGPVLDASDGSLYGTATGGGVSQKGTVFRLSPPASGTDWTETVLHSFAGGADGDNPTGPLLSTLNGKVLFGTTTAGGKTGNGTVFSLAKPTLAHPAWTYRQIAYFNGGALGSAPVGGVLRGADGALYGTTSAGGAANAGIVFRLAPSGGGKWAIQVLHDFVPATDGGTPYAGLTADASGTFWGVTTTGGTGGYGTVFKLTPPTVSVPYYAFSVVASFGADGGPASPGLGGLVIDGAGNVYGTTQNGGANGYGTAYQITP